LGLVHPDSLVGRADFRVGLTGIVESGVLVIPADWSAAVTNNTRMRDQSNVPLAHISSSVLAADCYPVVTSANQGEDVSRETSV